MPDTVSALILAGGQGRRMGYRDKGLVEYQGKPLVEHVLQRIGPQVDEILISANRNLDAYRAYGHCVLTDDLPDFQGPLAGMLAGLKAASHAWLLSVPCDMPALPDDLLARLLSMRGQERLVVAESPDSGRSAVMLMHASLLASLTDYLASGQRAVRGFQSQAGYASVTLPAEALRNFNTPGELES